MSTVKLNGLDALQGSIVEPRRGQWVAHVELDDDDAQMSGTFATIEFASETPGASESFAGTVHSGAVEHGRFVAVIVGGADGLDTVLDAKFYDGLTVKAVLDDIAAASGEVLDAAIPPDVLAHYLPRWHRRRAPAREGLHHLAAELGGFWRITRAGAVYLGKAETWPTLAVDAVETERDPGLGTFVLAPADAPTARPATTVSGDRIGQVLTMWSPQKIRQTLTIEREDGRPRDPQVAIAAIAERTSQRYVDYSRAYGAMIVSQAGDGSVEIYPDAELMRGTGLKGIPLYHGSAGFTIKVKPGQRCVLFFENGDPKEPRVMLAPDGSAVMEVTLAVETMLHLGALTSGAEQFVALAGKVLDELNAIKADLDNYKSVFDDHSHGGNGATPPAIKFQTPHTPASVAATKVKAT